MNLFISPLSGFSALYFFTEHSARNTNVIFEKIQMKRNQNFADVLLCNENWSKTRNIFFLSGPASFTTLRNLSVFLQTLQSFSKVKGIEYKFFQISVHEYLQLKYPQSEIQLLSVGKREVFVFRNRSIQKKKTDRQKDSDVKYEKIKNSKITHEIQEYCSSHTSSITSRIGGKEYITENVQEELSQENIIFSESEDMKNIFTEIQKNTEKYYTENIQIDYGAEPRLG